MVEKMLQTEKDWKKTAKEEKEPLIATIKQLEKKISDQSDLKNKLNDKESELSNLKKMKSTLEEKHEALINSNKKNDSIILELSNLICFKTEVKRCNYITTNSLIYRILHHIP